MKKKSISTIVVYILQEPFMPIVAYILSNFTLNIVILSYSYIITVIFTFRQLSHLHFRHLHVRRSRLHAGINNVSTWYKNQLNNNALQLQEFISI